MKSKSILKWHLHSQKSAQKDTPQGGRGQAQEWLLQDGQAGDRPSAVWSPRMPIVPSMGNRFGLQE